MIHENVELHNVAEVQQIEGRGGVRLQRVPEEVRLKLNPGAQQRMLSPANAEIRFVCEFELSDHIAGCEDWDLASLALSVNMIGAGFSPDEFYERVSYMVNTVAGSDTARPVACITIYPHLRDFGDQFSSPKQKGTPEEYRQKLREAVQACPHPNVHLLEGPDILTDIGGLSADLIHPADNGMIQMGENLARKLRELIPA